MEWAILQLRRLSRVRKGVAGFERPPPCFCQCQGIENRYSLYAALMSYIYQCVCAPFRNLTFASLSGRESIYLLKASTVTSFSHISNTASWSSLRDQPPNGFLRRSACFKILYTFSIRLRSSEEGGQSIEYIKHSTCALLQRPLFAFVSFFPCTVLPSSTTK